MLFYIFLIILSFIIAIFVRDYFNPLRKLPGFPLIDPIFGIFLVAVIQKGPVLRNMRVELPKFGNIRKCYLFLGQIRVLVSDPELVYRILVKDSKYYCRGNIAGVEYAKKVVGDSSLIFIDGEKHKRLRNVAIPAFRPKLLKSYFHFYQKSTNNLLNKWRQILDYENNNNAVVDVVESLNALTLDVIGWAGFGRDFDSFKLRSDMRDEDRPINLVSSSQLSILAVVPFYRLVYDIMHQCSHYLPQFMTRRIQRVNRLHAIAWHVIKDSSYTKGADFNGKCDSLLEGLLDGNEKGSVSEREIRDMLMTFILAGHETSSTALSWILLQLALHQTVQDTCYLHIKRFMDEKQGAELDFTDQTKLPYVTAVINETLRLYPPVPFVNRCTTRQEQFRDYSIPKDTDVLLLIAEMHRDPKVWGPDVEHFRPERINENPEAWKTSFMPFGDGIHKCIGYQFALGEIWTVLVLLLHEFHFSVVEGDEYVEQCAITLKPYPNPRLRIQRRHSQ